LKKFGPGLKVIAAATNFSELYTGKITDSSGRIFVDEFQILPTNIKNEKNRRV